MNNSPLEEILQPMIENRNTQDKLMPSLFYDVLIDLCSSNGELDSVICDMLRNQPNCFSIQRVLKMPNAKLEQVIRLLMQKYGCKSLLEALQSLLEPQFHVLLAVVLDYHKGRADFENLSLKFLSISTPSFDLLSLLVKLANFDGFAADFKNKLLTDNEVNTYALRAKCNDTLRLFILEQYISAFHQSKVEIGFHDKILFILNFIAQRNERQLSKAKRPFNTFDFKTLADLYEACLEKNIYELANYAFSISHHLSKTGHYTDRTRYYTNLLHLQSVLRIRQNVSINKDSSETNTNTILSHNLIKDLNSIYYFPSPHLFLANMHYQIANGVDLFDKAIYFQFISSTLTKQHEEVSDNLTKWTEFYTEHDTLPIDTYCNMLYIMLNFSHHLKVPLSVKQVTDVLKRLKPASTDSEKQINQYLKAIKYFDRTVAIPFEGAPCPTEIHNNILLAYTRINLFSEMKTKYFSMCTKDNQVDTHTYSLLIDSAVNEGIGDQCRFIFEYLWKDILAYQSLGNTVPDRILEGVVACMCICREHGKAISFLEKLFEEGRSLNVKIFDAFLSSCSLPCDVLALQDLKTILIKSTDEKHLGIIDKCSLKIDELESKQKSP